MNSQDRQRLLNNYLNPHYLNLIKGALQKANLHEVIKSKANLEGLDKIIDEHLLNLNLDQFSQGEQCDAGKVHFVKSFNLNPGTKSIINVYIHSQKPEQSIPIRQEPIPIRQEPIPIRQEPIPIRQDPNPIRQEPIPMIQELIPFRQQSLPIRQGPYFDEYWSDDQSTNASSRNPDEDYDNYSL